VLFKLTKAIQELRKTIKITLNLADIENWFIQKLMQLFWLMLGFLSPNF